jgi:hypothetical protein
MELDLDVGAKILLGLSGLRNDLASAAAKLERPFCRKVFNAFSGVVKADGTLQFKVWDVPDGMKFNLGKFIVWGDAHNPSTGGVYANAAAWAGLFHGAPGAANLADFWPYPEAASGQVLPYTREYGSLQAPEFRAPDNVFFYGTGFPVGENITVLLFGLMEETDITTKQNRRKRPSAIDMLVD